MFPDSNLISRVAVADNDSAVKSFDDYQNFLPKNNIKQGHLHDPYMPVAEVRQKLDQIKGELGSTHARTKESFANAVEGHLVWMPLDFLKDAAMAERGLQLNAYTESVYT